MRAHAARLGSAKCKVYSALLCSQCSVLCTVCLVRSRAFTLFLFSGCVRRACSALQCSAQLGSAQGWHGAALHTSGSGNRGGARRSPLTLGFDSVE